MLLSLPPSSLNHTGQWQSILSINCIFLPCGEPARTSSPAARKPHASNACDHTDAIAVRAAMANHILQATITPAPPSFVINSPRLCCRRDVETPNQPPLGHRKTFKHDSSTTLNHQHGTTRMITTHKSQTQKNMKRTHPDLRRHRVWGLGFRFRV